MVAVYLRFKYGRESYTSSGDSTFNLRPKVGEESSCVDIGKRAL